VPPTPHQAPTSPPRGGSTYAITPTLGSLTASNYDFTTFNAGTLTVNPRMPTAETRISPSRRTIFPIRDRP